MSQPQYWVIRHQAIAEFERRVNEALTDGWRVQGGPMHDEQDGYYCQAMIRPAPAAGEVLKEPAKGKR